MVLDFDETVAGYASYGRNRVPALAFSGEIFELYLAPEYQGGGLGPAHVRGRARANLPPTAIFLRRLGARRQRPSGRILSPARRQHRAPRSRDASAWRRASGLRSASTDPSPYKATSRALFCATAAWSSTVNLDAISIGNNPPDEVNVVIEVPIGGEPIKYEMDKATGALVVDRFLYTSMRYPGNYGFIPHTLSDDGDPCDVIVANTRAIVPGAVMRCRLVGVLLMEDEAGGDEKLIAVPVGQAHPALREGRQLHRPARDHAEADRAFLRPLQGPGARQMGQDRPLGRRRRGAQAGAGRHRARQDGEGRGDRGQGPALYVTVMDHMRR